MILGFITIIFLSQYLNFVQSEKLINGNCKPLNDTSCKPGVLLPVWQPSDQLSIGDKSARAFVYFSALLYLFLGVSIIADRFMASIEVITSKERKIIIKKPNGELQAVYVRIWNETVSNLTLMALGSSAPEILLSIIEICGNKFEAGDMGPGTIVGSAAFNLFIIIAICVYVIPDGEVRKIKHLSVFLITATWSIFAYLWLYLIIAIISPEEIDIWEAFLTFAFFFLTVLTAYIADTKLFFKGLMKRRYLRKNIKSYALDGGDHEMQCNHYLDNPLTGEGQKYEDLTEFEKTRMDFIDVIREIRQKNPNIDPKTLEEQAQIEVLNRVPKSRAFYRMQATRTLTGSGNVIKKSKIESKLSSETDKGLLKVGASINQRLFFDPGHYTVMENVGVFFVSVTREGTDEQINNTRVEVGYATEDGSANAGEDYVATSGTLVFKPGETRKQIEISIIDDDIFEEDEHFYVKLNDPKLKSEDGKKLSNTSAIIPGDVELIDPSVATVMVLDDDHAGIFHFSEERMSVSESIGEAEIKVCRSSGARGVIVLPYRTRSGTAIGGKDYIEIESYLEFLNDQTEAYIKITIIDDNEYEKDEHFTVELGEPVIMKKADGHSFSFSGSVKLPHDMMKFNHTEDSIKTPNGLETQKSEIEDMGKPRLGDIKELKVVIKESMEFKHVVDNLLKHGNLSDFVGTSSWKEQFVEAITVNPGDGDGGEDEDSPEKLPSCMDYIMHFLTLFWKVMFAFVPPTEYLGGWVSFTVCIIVIGFLTAIIGDLAAGFGCTVGLTNAVTAITFVALGTSLPDTFASKVAAINDDTADSSVGNVTGSNAVNVFLGIGLAWLIASIYHYFNGTKLKVQSGSLGFSVTLFCLFALTAIFFMLIRRHPKIGGELGGPRRMKIFTTLYFVGLWVAYIILSSMENYCHIEGF